MVEKTNIKNKLEQLYDTRKEISEIEAKLDKIEKEGIKIASVQASYKRPPFTKHDIIVEAQAPETKEKINYYKSILQGRLEKLLEIQTEVEEYIAELPTSRLRRIFELKYIEQYAWRKIAYIMGNGATEESIKKEHNRHLKKLD